jgi:hypothetical protein
MTEFLAGLAARATTDRAAVRPRPDAVLLSRLSATDRERSVEDVEDEGGVIAPRRSRQRREPFPIPPDTAPELTSHAPPREALTARSHAEPASHEPPTHPLRPPGPVGTEVVRAPTAPSQPARTRSDEIAQPPAAAPTGLVRERTAAMAPPPPQPITARPLPATPPLPDRSAAKAVAVAPVITPRAVAPVPARSRDGEQARPPIPPVEPVEIVIDRVDVRVVSAPAPPRRPRTAPPGPMTLERYLESRGNR